MTRFYIRDLTLNVFRMYNNIQKVHSSNKAACFIFTFSVAADQIQFVCSTENRPLLKERTKGKSL